MSGGYKSFMANPRPVLPVGRIGNQEWNRQPSHKI